MELKTVGYYREMPLGLEQNPSIKEFINLENPDQVEAICQYLRNGTLLIASFGLTTDVIDPEKGISGTPSAYTDGTWVWPGDLVYYVEKYLLKLPEDFIQTMEENHWINPVADADFADEPLVIDGIELQ